MEPPEKKRRGVWSENQLQAALDAVKTRRMSQRVAAATYSIPRRTLRNHLKSGVAKKVTGRAPILTEEQEKDLTKRIIKLAKIGIPLTPKLVRKQAYVFCQTNKIPHCFSDKKSIAGKKWLRNFIRRNSEISVRKAQFMNSARAQKLNKFIVSEHFQTIKKIYDELDISSHPERLYNIDEKGCRLTLHHQQKVLAAKGTKRVHFIAEEHAENVTIAACVNAVGNAIPPMILFKGKRLKPEFNDNLPAGSLVKMAPKGSMTTELFVDFMNHFAKFKASGKCLLVFDGASSHLDARIVDAADENDIVLYCLPSNTTHELQPLDKSVNKSYEHFWDEEVLLYTYQHPEHKLTKTRFNKIFTKVWSKCMTQSNIINGFRATGLYPYDPNVIPDEAYAPSILTQRPDPQGIVQRHPQVSDLREARVSSSIHNDTDADITDCEDNILCSMSPSTIVHDVDALLWANDISPKISENTMKLVDYSSSSSEATVEDVAEKFSTPSKDLCGNITPKSRTPIPSTSGVFTQRRTLIHSSTSDSDDEYLDITSRLQNHFQRKHEPRNINIYSSSSDSEAENVNPCAKKNSIPVSDQEQFNSEDDIPLSELKTKPVGREDAEKKTPFQQLIPTPNFATVKSKPRRKALNYKGQRITKDLFKRKEEKDGKQKTKITKEKQKRNGKEKRQKNKKILKKTGNKTGWYCHACKCERIADMRQCKDCMSWYHEECVGLTKDDNDQFVCPECN